MCKWRGFREAASPETNALKVIYCVSRAKRGRYEMNLYEEGLEVGGRRQRR